MSMSGDAYQQRFGLGQATGEGLPAEASGALLAPDEWSGSAYGSVPIGYSVDATLIQMTAAYNAIANNGTYVQPHLIKDTIAPNGKVTPGPAASTHQVLTPEVAAELRTILQAPVNVDGATGTRAKVPNYLAAGRAGPLAQLFAGDREQAGRRPVHQLQLGVVHRHGPGRPPAVRHRRLRRRPQRQRRPGRRAGIQRHDGDHALALPGAAEHHPGAHFQDPSVAARRVKIFNRPATDR